MKKELRQIVYQKYRGHCAYCGKKLKYSEMQVDHIVSKHFGGENDLSNYNPSCRSCNFYMSSDSLELFRKHLLTIHKRIVKPFTARVGIDYGIVKIKPFDGKFYFEKEGFDE